MTLGKLEPLHSWILVLLISLAGCARPGEPSNTTGIDSTTSNQLDSTLLKFYAYKGNPVFAGTGTNTWDHKIRERGYILFEDGTYHLWYTGYKDDDSDLHLGYATSPDGINWTRYAQNPIVNEGWIEDMIVVKRDSVYYMFAEGRNDIAHLLTSTDRVHWKEQGSLDIRYKDGKPLSPGPYGTPTAWYENNIWYLLYERGDLGIWLATSADLKTWTNVQDEPVLKNGPEAYDKYGVAVNQVVKRNGIYYAYYHATAVEDWGEWSSCVATSTDRLHWTKYSGNPLLKENKSSPITVDDGKSVRLYSMHPAVALHTSSTQ
ncbi:glycosylase [Chryseolinea sp. T2]|uniref:glycosylase n=1 Tax=Chryseolinea sp. T2 TaxID=3129255 RepID=UPI003077FE69